MSNVKRISNIRKFIGLLNDFEIAYRMRETKNFREIILTSNTNRVEGYIGFETSFFFTRRGKFLSISIYEE